MNYYLRRCLAICILLMTMTGCVTCSPNLRVWISGNLKAVGALATNGKAAYDHIHIGTDELPYDGRQTFVIRLTNGILLSSADLSETTIRRIALTLFKPSERSILHDSITGISTYTFDGVIFGYVDNRLLTIDIVMWRLPEKTCIPEIAKSEDDTFSPFPISEECLRRIFGTPDIIRDIFVW